MPKVTPGGDDSGSLVFLIPGPLLFPLYQATSQYVVGSGEGKSVLLVTNREREFDRPCVRCTPHDALGTVGEVEFAEWMTF